MKQQRSKTLLFTLVLFYFLVLGRLFYWQVVKGPVLKEKALSQTYKLQKKLPQRGQIFTSDGYPLVLNQKKYQLSIYKPNLEEDITPTISKIEQIKPDFSDVDKNTINFLLSNENQKWQTFSTLFDKSDMESLAKPGLVFEEINKRFYPENSLANNILGIVGKNSLGNDIGYGGLEGYYNKQLKGKTGFSWITKDATGKTILTKKSWRSEDYNGLDLHTSIDRRIQYHIEKVLNRGIEEFSADSGSVTVMESSTGSILGMASLVATDSATPSALKNPAISDLFEPGSIFKPLVVAMALDSDSIGKNFICTICDRPRVIGEYTINNWNFETHPDSSLFDIIKNSDNIGMSSIIAKLGKDKFLGYYKKLGLDQKTGIDLQGEAKAPLKQYWPEIDLATASFGQGISVTQINMLQAFNSIANDGRLVKPRVVTKIDDNGKLTSPHPPDTADVFTQETMVTLKEILKYSVENSAVDRFRPENLEVCAKSGTAQVAVKGSYTDSSTIASYIGFSPCINPKFTMIVTINNPKSSPWGSSTAAPIWFELASILNNLL